MQELGEHTDVYSVGPGDYIKVGSEFHEIASIEFIRKGDRTRNWNVTTVAGGRFNMLEIGSYHRKLPPLAEFHEIWWIVSAGEQPWAGLRIAHFRKATDGTDIVIIQGEIDQRRIGIRIWSDIKDREGWRRVTQIAIPSAAEIDAVLK